MHVICTLSAYYYHVIFTVYALCTRSLLSQFLAAEGRYVYTTPKSYLELLKLFISLLEKKHVEADAAISRLEGGVLKLAESAEAVANLEDNLKVIALKLNNVLGTT